MTENKNLNFDDCSESHIYCSKNLQLEKGILHAESTEVYYFFDDDDIHYTTRVTGVKLNKKRARYMW